MKYLVLILIGALSLTSGSSNAQTQHSREQGVDSSVKIYVITKNDGTVYVGKVLSQDAREVLIETKELGQIVIPKHEIKEIREMKPGEMNNRGVYIGQEAFSTRYFLTTNALALEQGEGYVQWHWFGPDFQFGVGKKLSVGIMTSWMGMPIIGSVKYSIKLAEKANFAVGSLVGTGSWARPNFGLALPFAALSFGTHTRNINISAGYGAVFDESQADGTFLLSLGAMTKVGKKVSLVFDSFLVPRSDAMEDFGLLIPGVRVQTREKRAFQFGFAGVYADGELFEVPIPFLSIYQKL